MPPTVRGRFFAVLIGGIIGGLYGIYCLRDYQIIEKLPPKPLEFNEDGSPKKTFFKVSFRETQPLKLKPEALERNNLLRQKLLESQLPEEERLELEKQRAIEKAKQEKEQEEKRLLEELEKERMEKERQLYKTRQFERVKQIQKEFIASQEDFARRKMAETEALENLGN